MYPVAIRAGGPLLKRAGDLVLDFFTKNTDDIARAAARAGLSGRVSASKLAQMVKNNKMTAAFVLYETGSVGADLLAELAAQDAEIAKVVELFGMEPDSVSETESVTELYKFEDEFDIISTAVRQFGSFDRALAVRQAMALDPSVWKLYYQARETGRRLA